MDTAAVLDKGRRAFDQRNWPDAYDRLTEAAGATQLGPDDLERLATAAYLTGHDDVSTDAWTRAHQAWLDRDRQEQAVRCAFWLGFGLVQRGEMAQGGGWLARAARLVEQHRLDCVERGYLVFPEALRAMAGGDPGAALQRFEEVSALAQRFGDPDLAALGGVGQGQALLALGRVAHGMRLFDEAMVSVTTGAEFFWQYVHSTPLAAIVGELDEVARVALEHDVVERCQPFVDCDAAVTKPGLLVTSGRRPSGDDR